MRRVIAVLILVVGLGFPTSALAGAPTDGDVDIDGEGLDLGAKDPGTPSPDWNKPSSPSKPSKPSNSGGGGPSNPAAPAGDDQCNAGENIGCGWAPALGGGPAAPPPPPPNPVELAREATGRLNIPAPSAQTSPKAPVKALVGLQTWLWIDQAQWRPLTASVTTGATTVTATVQPIGTRWNMGEGTKGCTGPGKPWRKGLGQDASTECGYTYKRTSLREPDDKYRVSTVVTYSASWTCAGACTSGGGDLGTVDSPAAASALEVGERQSVVIR